MLTSFPFAFAIGTILGFLSGLGIGGGSLLILWLGSVLGTSVETARIINLMFFLPCAVICNLFRLKQGILSYRKILPAIVAGCIGAIISANAHMLIPTELLKKLFGGLLILTGLKELFYRRLKAK